MEHLQLLKEISSEMGFSLSEKQLSQFMLYKDLLLEWNETINLTAITDQREIIIKHFADCISIGETLPFQENATLIDVGTGAGFPGVPLKIVFPSLQVTLLDSLQKRVSFLDELVEKLELDDVSCIHSRAEDGGKNPAYREQFDYCVSRAVANLAVLSEYCLPFVKEGGCFISLKGPDVEEEVEEAKNAIGILGGEIIGITPVAIPMSDLHHSLVFIKKIGQTPKQYPRKAGKISKNPMK